MTPEVAAALLTLARAAVGASARGLPGPATDLPGVSVQAGVFVSLFRDGELRGCIGHLEADRPLAELVAAMAVEAATSDPRFAPVTADELDGLAVQVSVLTPYAPASPGDVVPGRDGVLVRQGRRQGVLLPQVATEQGWDRDTLLDGACRKAGLPPGAWRQPGTQLFTFQTQSFPTAVP